MKNLNLGKWRVTACLFFIFLFLLPNSSTITCAQSSFEAHIYCFPEYPSSEMVFSYFSNRSDWKVVLYDLNDSTSLDIFLNMTRALTVLGITVISPDLCTACLLKSLTWEEILAIYGSPLIGFFRDGRLTAMTIGIIDSHTLDQVVLVDEENVKVFTPLKQCSLSGREARTELEKFFFEEGKDKTEIQVSALVLPITLLALADSVNPCTFALFTALLFVTLHSLGKMRAAATGFSFISAIFIGYYVLGLGFFSILAAVPHISKALAILGLILGIYNIMRGLKIKFRSPIPKSLRRLTEFVMRKSYANIMASFILGLTATLTLLPCSGGPYLVGLGLLSTLKDSVQAYLLLVLYNILFVMPLILVLAIVLVSSSMLRRIKVFRSANLGIMELASGAILAIVCIYLLASY